MGAFAYVDVRGPWPILVLGNFTFVLEGEDRDITPQRALEIFRSTR